MNNKNTIKNIFCNNCNKLHNFIYKDLFFITIQCPECGLVYDIDFKKGD